MMAKLARMIRETWYFWLLIACVGYVSGRQDGNLELSGRAEFIISFAFSFSMALWVVTDARRREQSLGYGFAALVFFLWPVFAPVYLFQTRGVRAFLSSLAFAGMFVVSISVGGVIGMMLPRN
jgi:hypothetical protein